MLFCVILCQFEITIFFFCQKSCCCCQRHKIKCGKYTYNTAYIYPRPEAQKKQVRQTSFDGIYDGIFLHTCTCRCDFDKNELLLFTLIVVQLQRGILVQSDFIPDLGSMSCSKLYVLRNTTQILISIPNVRVHTDIIKKSFNVRFHKVQKEDRPIYPFLTVVLRVGRNFALR